MALYPSNKIQTFMFLPFNYDIHITRKTVVSGTTLKIKDIKFRTFAIVKNDHIERLIGKFGNLHKVTSIFLPIKFTIHRMPYSYYFPETAKPVFIKNGETRRIEAISNSEILVVRALSLNGPIIGFLNGAHLHMIVYKMKHFDYKVIVSATLPLQIGFNIFVNETETKQQNSENKFLVESNIL